jgi:hypothetical protein
MEEFENKNIKKTHRDLRDDFHGKLESISHLSGFSVIS